MQGCRRETGSDFCAPPPVPGGFVLPGALRRIARSARRSDYILLQGERMNTAGSGTGRIVVMGASSGGLAALRAVLPYFPNELDAPVLVVMHIGKHSSVLPELLAPYSSLPVAHAGHDATLRGGQIFVAPPDRHMMVEGGRIRLTSGPKENFTRPAIDPLFRSAAVEFGARAVAVVLTGHLDDGAAGAVAIHACGGTVIVQDPADCVAPSMPLSTLRAVPMSRVTHLGKVGDAIVKAVQTPVKGGGMKKTDKQRFEIETRIGLTGVSTPADLDRIGERTTLTCPECGGVVWQVGSDAPLRFRCHTGHAFSSETLDGAQRSELEDAIWTGVRKAVECAALARDKAERAAAQGDNASADEARQEHARLETLGETLRALALQAATE